MFFDMVLSLGIFAHACPLALLSNPFGENQHQQSRTKGRLLFEPYASVDADLIADLANA